MLARLLVARSVLLTRADGERHTMHIDDIVASLKAVDQPAASKHFGITDEQWKRWRETAGKA